MKKNIILLSIFLMYGCVPPENKVTEINTAEQKSLTIPHNIDECPDLTGVYYREYNNSGEIFQEDLNLTLQVVNDRLEFFNGEETEVVDGHSHKKTSVLDHQLGCSKGELVVQASLLGSPISEIRYSINDDILTIAPKSLDINFLRFEGLKSFWQKKY